MALLCVSQAVTFAAVELRDGEVPHKAVQYIMETANAQGRLFKSLELLGVLTLGRMRFIRFRFESKALSETLTTLDRGVVQQQGANYMLTFPNTEPRKVDIVTMTTLSGDPGIKRIYRGPGAQFWKRQFL